MNSEKITVKTTLITLSLMCFLLFFVLASCSNKNRIANQNDDYYMAAYIWPSCHDEAMSREALWGKGIGEWEIIKQGDQRFEGHYQPRVPLWNYEMDNDPAAVEKKIKTATDHGINVFIYDWYWYDGKPFLEETVNDGFLKAKNNDLMKFYLMWANHDANGYQWNHYRYKNDTILWKGEVDWANFKIIVDRVIKQYFKQPNYFKIDNKPVFSVYSITKLVQSFNGLEGTKEALDYFRQEVIKAGFPGLHIQLTAWGRNGKPSFLGENYAKGKSINEIISMLEISSITTYHWSGIDEDYLKWGESEISLRDRWDSTLTVPYFANATVGYDDTPRFPKKGKESVVHINNSPVSFATYLQKAVDYTRRHPEQPRLILINAWNEWVEGSYLEPDMKWGYGYLEAVKDVMSGKYDRNLNESY